MALELIVMALRLAVPLVLLLGLIYAGRKWPTVVASGVLLVICLAPVALLLVQVWLRLCGVTVEGVVEHVRQRTIATGGGGARFIHIATVRFQTPDGVWRTRDATVGPTTMPGQPLLLYYAPGMPSRATRLYSRVEVLLLIALLLAAFSLTTCFLAWVADTGGFG